MHFDDGLHLLLPLNHSLHLSLDLLDILGPTLEVHHQLLTVHNLSLLLGILNLQPQLLTSLLNAINF